MPRMKSTHVDDPVLVGQRLREARTAKGLSQRDLAFTGCSAAYISRIEKGDRIPSLQLLRELGRRLGVTEEYLATGSGLPSRHLRVTLDPDVLDTALRGASGNNGGVLGLDDLSEEEVDILLARIGAEAVRVTGVVASVFIEVRHEIAEVTASAEARVEELRDSGELAERVERLTAAAPADV